jgi:uncharacterized protein
MPQDPLSVIQNVYAAFGRGDIPALLDALAPDVRWEVVGREGEYPTFGVRHGLDGALAFFQALGGIEEITAFEPLSLHPSGDDVFVQGRVALTLKTNGRPLAYDWLHVFAVRDGKVAAFREFYDTAQVVEAYRA